jgi:predicted metalloprotease with PDZ domain
VEISRTPVHYRLDLSNTKSRELGVGMTVDLPSSEPLDLVMPHLSPGSPTKSLDHESRIRDLRVTNEAGQKLPFVKQEDGSFRVIRDSKGPVTVNYTVQADEFSHVRNNVTDDFAYISGAGSMMYVKGRDTDLSSLVELKNVPSADWKSLSTLAEVKSMPHAFWANSYQDIADSNIFSGQLNSVSDRFENTELVVNVHGEAPWDEAGVKGVSPEETMQDLKGAFQVLTKNFGHFSLERVKDAAPRPAEVQQNDKYVLNKHYVKNGSGYSGGFEHYHGHELILDSKAGSKINRDFDGDSRTFERGILVHELVHKMLAKFVTHDGIDSEDLSKVGQTDGLWVTEGVTDWTGTVLERQAGMLNFGQYGKILEGFYDRYDRNMAQNPTSPLEDSKEAHSGNSNYYNKGAVAASLLDLEIRHHTGNQKGMFDVIRDLKDEFGGTGRGHTLDDMERLTLKQVQGNEAGEKRIQEFYDRHLRGREAMDINRSLAHVGYQTVEVEKPISSTAKATGRRTQLKLEPLAEPTADQLRLREAWQQAELSPLA